MKPDSRRGHCRDRQAARRSHRRRGRNQSRRARSPQTRARTLWGADLRSQSRPLDPSLNHLQRTEPLHRPDLECIAAPKLAATEEWPSAVVTDVGGGEAGIEVGLSGVVGGGRRCTARPSRGREATTSSDRQTRFRFGKNDESQAAPGPSSTGSLRSGGVSSRGLFTE